MRLVCGVRIGRWLAVVLGAGLAYTRAGQHEPRTGAALDD